MGIYALYGFNGWLYRDDAIYLYAGQQFAEGIPPYVSIFDHKTPLSPILSGIFVSAGRLAGIDDVLAVRLGWWLLSGMAGGVLFLLGRTLFRSSLAGLMAGLALTGFWSFGREAVSGPRAKTPFLLFQLLFFLMAAHRRWGWAGCVAALATWVWQPGIVFVLLALILPLLERSEERAARWKGAGQAAVGVLFPSLILFGYFIAKGAFGPLIDGAVLFNLTHLDRPPFELWAHLEAPVRSLFKGYALMALPGIAGLLYFLYAAHVRFHDGPRRIADWAAWRAAALALPFVIGWTILDFQGAADLYPFLPYMALGLAGLAWQLGGFLGEMRSLPWLSQRGIIIALIALMGLLSASLYHRTGEDGLVAQRVSAGQVFDRFTREGEVASIGLPELLVLGQARNPNPYGFIIAGIDRKIMEETEGGVAGFMGQLTAGGVRAVGIGPTEGQYRDLLIETLEQSYKKERFGYFDVYVGIKLPDPPSDPLQN
jgi:hypothetical protein